MRQLPAAIHAMFSRDFRISGEMDGPTPISNAEEVAAGFSKHQHLVVANGAHGIIGYPELTPAMLTFLRGQRITQLRVSFPKWEFNSPQTDETKRALPQPFIIFR